MRIALDMYMNQLKAELKIATEYLKNTEDYLYLVKTAFSVLIISPVLYVTGFRFSKDYRHEATKFHALVYKFVNTTAANRVAGL